MRGSPRAGIHDAVTGQLRQRGVGMARDVARHIQGMQPVDADEQGAAGLVVTVVRPGGECHGRRDREECREAESLFQ